MKVVRSGRIVLVVFLVSTALMVAVTVHSSPRAFADAGTVTVMGTVTDQNGQGIDNVIVTATDPGGSTPDFPPVQTLSDGTYTLPNVTTATYDFHFDPGSGSGFNSIIDSNVTVTTDPTIVNIQLTSITTHTFSGTITDSFGTPISQMQVLLSGPGSPPTFFTKSDGAFSIIALPGSYQVRLIYPGSETPTMLEGTELFPFAINQGFTVDLTNGDVSENLVLSFVKLSVTVQDSSGNPLSGVQVRATQNGGSTVLAAGGASLTVPLGSNGPAEATDGNGQIVGLVPQGSAYPAGTICATLTGNKVCNNAAITASGDVNLLLKQAPIDHTPPTLGTPTWSTNPVAVGSNTTLTVPASDDLSGVATGEYYIGTDPGVGNGTSMPYSGGNLTATFGSTLGVGVYTIGVRAQDSAGNWSPATTTMLVVYDPNTTLGMTGKNKKDLVPSLAHGDMMPGLISSTQTDAADYGMTVQYKQGSLDPQNAFVFTYSTGTNCGKPTAQNCHSFSLTASSFAWLVITGTNNSHGEFRGTALVTVDGTTTTNPFTVSGIDGDLLSPATSDYLILEVYAPGADPTTASPLYQASGFMAKGNSVVIK